MQTSVVPAVADSMSFPFAEPPAAGSVCEVAPELYWLRMPLPFALNHINLWLLRDGKGWTAVDCGIASVASHNMPADIAPSRSPTTGRFAA